MNGIIDGWNTLEILIFSLLVVIGCVIIGIFQGWIG